MDSLMKATKQLNTGKSGGSDMLLNEFFYFMVSICYMLSFTSPF